MTTNVADRRSKLRSAMMILLVSTLFPCNAKHITERGPHATHEAWLAERAVLMHERPRETVWKSEWGRSMTYALGHEKELLHRSIQRRMGVSGDPCSGSQQAGTTENPLHPRG